MASTWRAGVSTVAWRAVLVFAVVLLGGAVEAVVDRDAGWGWQAGTGLVFGLLALGIALDLRRRGRTAG